MAADTTVWGIHGGKFGAAENLFKQQSVIALGFSAVGNLRLLAADREAFKTAVGAAYPEQKPGAIPVNAGQLFRFAHEVAVGDLVVWPTRSDKQIRIGRIEGDYQHDPRHEPNFPHRRTVSWLKAFPRTRFSQGALYEIGSAITFFQIKAYVDEFLSALERKEAPPVPTVNDDTVAAVAEEIEQTTRDFVLKTLARELKGHPFAHFVAHLMEKMGYRTRISDEGPDGGIDIIAHRDELGFEPPIIKVQVKSTEGAIGDPVASALYGKLAQQGEYALLMSLGTYTNQAKIFARSKGNLRLIDGDGLVDLVLQHYEKFDSRYKALLPMKRVYVPDPDPLEAAED